MPVSMEQVDEKKDPRIYTLLVFEASSSTVEKICPRKLETDVKFCKLQRLPYLDVRNRSQVVPGGSPDCLVNISIAQST